MTLTGVLNWKHKSEVKTMMGEEVKDNDFGLTKLVTEAKQRESTRKKTTGKRLKGLRAWNKTWSKQVRAQGKVVRERTLGYLPPEPVTVSELAVLTGNSPETTRYHLDLLVGSGKVKVFKSTRSKTYRRTSNE